MNPIAAETLPFSPPPDPLAGLQLQFEIPVDPLAVPQVLPDRGTFLPPTDPLSSTTHETQILRVEIPGRVERFLDGLTRRMPILKKLSRVASRITGGMTKHEGLIAMAGGAAARFLTVHQLAPWLGFDPASADRLVGLGVRSAGIAGLALANLAEKIPTIETKHPKLLKWAKRISADAVMASLGWGLESMGEGIYHNVVDNIHKQEPTLPQAEGGQDARAGAGESTSTTTENQGAGAGTDEGANAGNQDQGAGTGTGKGTNTTTTGQESGVKKVEPSSYGDEPTDTNSWVPPESGTTPSDTSSTASTTQSPVETNPMGAHVTGTVTESNLTFNEKPWQLLSNGYDNIRQLLGPRQLGTVTIQQDVLGAKLDEAVKLWNAHALDPKTNPDLWKLFHLSNGTGSVIESLQNKDILTALQNLGVVK